MNHKIKIQNGDNTIETYFDTEKEQQDVIGDIILTLDDAADYSVYVLKLPGTTILMPRMFLKNSVITYSTNDPDTI